MSGCQIRLRMVAEPETIGENPLVGQVLLEEWVLSRTEFLGMLGQQSAIIHFKIVADFLLCFLNLFGSFSTSPFEVFVPGSCNLSGLSLPPPGPSWGLDVWRVQGHARWVHSFILGQPVCPVCSSRSCPRLPIRSSFIMLYSEVLTLSCHSLARVPSLALSAGAQLPELTISQVGLPQSRLQCLSRKSPNGGQQKVGKCRFPRTRHVSEGTTMQWHQECWAFRSGGTAVCSWIRLFYVFFSGKDNSTWGSRNYILGISTGKGWPPWKPPCY